jgi:hypothetical protein
MQDIKKIILQINEENSNEKCKEIAQKLMCKHQLIIKNNKFDIVELEFYIYSKQHPDPYAHKNPLQKTFGKFYVHTKDGNYGGIDITIGNQENDIYGGVLIRGLKTENGIFYSGPNIVKKEIYKILNVNNYKKLQEIIDESIKIVPNNNNGEEIQYSTRIGLKPKFEDYQKNGKYIYKLHRFVTYVNNPEHGFKEKKRLIQYTNEK